MRMQLPALVILASILNAGCSESPSGPAVGRGAQLSVNASDVSVAAGGQFSCALIAGTIRCWGNDADGQSSPPAGLFSQFSVGERHACALRPDQSLICWGANERGQANAPAGAFTQVSAGALHTCGLRTDNVTLCWGSNTFGQITPPADAFTQLAAEEHSTCGLRADGTIACWGYNDFGNATPPTGTYRSLAVGGYQGCALRADGTMVCWGRNHWGQAIAPAGQFRQVSVGEAHVCAIRLDGTLHCWGYNGHGQTNAPPGTFVQVSNGDYHTCAVRDSGAVLCWGYNEFGQTDVPAFDITPPVITFAGNAGSYTVDQFVQILCSVTDADSGVASSTCPDAVGDAFTFGLGTTTLHAAATDLAGNHATQTASFEVRATATSVCNLVRRWVAQQGVANSLCQKLRTGSLHAFENEINAQAGKHVPPDRAALLGALARGI